MSNISSKSFPRLWRGYVTTIWCRARAAFEASLERCPHCQRRFVPKAFQHHSKSCTTRNPAKPAGTGLTSMSLTNRLVPGAIAGSKHGNASKYSWLSSLHHWSFTCRQCQSSPANIRVGQVCFIDEVLLVWCYVLYICLSSWIISRSSSSMLHSCTTSTALWNGY